MRRLLLITVTLFMVSITAKSQILDDTLSIDEVVVTGSRIEVSRKNLPINVSVINNKQIDEIQESSVLPMVSRRIPGLFVTERGVTGFGRTGSTSAGNISIRGVGGNPNAQVLVLVDGHPQYMGIFGHPLPNSYVASDLERVEIIKGPASILYGSNAMGGVLNFITKEQKEEGFSGSLRAAYGSFNTQKYMANTGFRYGKFSMFVSLNHDQTDGHRDSMNFNINNGYFKTGYKINDNIEISADFNLAEFRSFDPGMVNENVEAFQADMLRGKASFSISDKYKNAEGGLFAFYNYGDHDFSDGWKSRDENYGVSLYQGVRLFEDNLITAGVDYKNFGGRGNAAFPPTYANQWVTVDEMAGYLIIRQQLMSVLDLSAGVRVENNSLFGNEILPQFGLAYQPWDNTSLKLSVSKGFRSPTIMELYLFAPNQELQPESMWSYETGISQLFLQGKLKTELNIYYLEGSNLIQVGPNPNGPPPFIRMNTGDFTHYGVEFEGSYHPVANLSLDVSYSYLHMDTPKIAAPKNQGFAGISYRWNDISFALQSSLIGGLYTSTESSEGINEINEEDYVLLNASIKYDIKEFLELYISGKNLTDTQYEIDYGYPMPGINFMIGVGFKF